MKKEFILIVLAGLLTVSAFAQQPEDGKGIGIGYEVQELFPIEHPMLDRNWTVVFEDNFNTLNQYRWYKASGPRHPGEGAKESVEYRTFENVFDSAGTLVLRTQKQDHQCTSTNCRYESKIHPYTSGAITSCAQYKYGYYEIRAKLPVSKGFAPSLWFWNQSPSTQTSDCWYNEINVFEVNACSPYTYGARIHCDFDCPEPGNEKVVGGTITKNLTNYHWYGLEWNEDKITWYFDRKMVWQEINNWQGQGVQHALYMILTVELNGSDCPIPNNTTFPKDMVIDQMNVYSLICDSTPVVEIPDFENFNYGVKKSITLSGATTIPSRNRISLRATDFIELQSGFEVPLWAELYLDVHPCSATVVVVE